jgi:hypothetical protein
MIFDGIKKESDILNYSKDLKWRLVDAWFPFAYPDALKMELNMNCCKGRIDLFKLVLDDNL